MLSKGFIAGFICGEGSFSQWNVTYKGRPYKIFRFCITQHERALSLLQEIKESIGYGSIRKKSSPKKNPVFVEYMITHRQDLVKFFNEISPFLKGYKKDQAFQWYQDLIAYTKSKNNE